MNIQERIEALETEFAEKIKTLKAEVQREDEFPQLGDEYWYVDEFGAVCSYELDEFFNEDVVKEMKVVGNIFKNKEQAEFAVEKLKVEAELWKFSKPFKRDSLNFIMCFDTEEDKLYGETKRFMTQGVLYFEGIGQLERAIEAVGAERVKKYIFGVED